MSIDWHSIKSFNGPQANAFEELVCQLARMDYQFFEPALEKKYNGIF